RQLLPHRFGLVEQRLMRREVAELPAVGSVGGADPERREPRQDVELRQEDLAQPVEPRSVPQHHGVEPAAPALASGRRAELLATDAESLAVLAEILGREGSCTYTRDVGLRDADHTLDVLRSDTRRRERVSRNRCGG